MDGYKVPEQTTSKEIKPLPKTSQDPEEEKKKKEAKLIAETVVAIVKSNTYTEAADLLQITRRALYDRIKKYELKPIIDSFVEQAFDTLKMASIDAAEEFAKQLKHSRVDIRTEAAREILDRIGVRQAPQAPNVAIQVNNNITAKDLTEEEMDAIISRG